MSLKKLSIEEIMVKYDSQGLRDLCDKYYLIKVGDDLCLATRIYEYFHPPKKQKEKQTISDNKVLNTVEDAIDVAELCVDCCNICTWIFCCPCRCCMVL